VSDRFLNHDQEYLRTVQYGTENRLNARTSLHTKYSTAEIPWFEWLRHQVDLSGDQRVLEVGCGTGQFWETSLDDLGGVDLTVTDLARSMVDITVAKASGRVNSVTGFECDVQDLPFSNQTFDVIIANQMLYHVPEPTLAIRELARVLRPNGTLLASTVGPRHLRELFALEAAIFGATRLVRHHEIFGSFSGLQLLQSSFDDVAWRPYDDRLNCTEGDDVIAYIMSMPPGEDASDEDITRLRVEVDRRLSLGGGVLTVTKDVGAFVARRAK
jgi:2-polyprenyl-3-methyl-5-hydroxy-6-metoxy-1,4-benzoquinol methylase